MFCSAAERSWFSYHNVINAVITFQVVFSRLEMEDSPIPSLDLVVSSVDRRPCLQTRAIEALLSPQPMAPEATPTALTSPSLSSKETAEDARTMESLYEASMGFQGEAGEAAPSSASGVESEGVLTEMKGVEAVEGEDDEGCVSSNQGLDDVALGVEEAGDGKGKVVEEITDEIDEGRQETGDRDADDGAGNKLTVSLRSVFCVVFMPLSIPPLPPTVYEHLFLPFGVKLMVDPFLVYQLHFPPLFLIPLCKCTCTRT